MLQVEKGICFLPGSVAQQGSFINDMLISDKLKWLCNWISLTA